MKRTFVIEDDTKAGKMLLGIISSVREYDKKSVKEYDSLIMPGARLTDEELEQDTIAAEESGEVTLLEFKEEMATYFSKKKKNGDNTKKRSKKKN
jgi:hypothetical protein